MSFNLIYSSKNKVIFSSLKKVVFNGGTARINTGGKLSLAPPVGLPLLAQREIDKIKITLIMYRKFFRMNLLLVQIKG
jgi:hypothetical protein